MQNVHFVTNAIATRLIFSLMQQQRQHNNSYSVTTLCFALADEDASVDDDDDDEANNALDINIETIACNVVVAALTGAQIVMFLMFLNVANANRSNRCTVVWLVDENGNFIFGAIENRCRVRKYFYFPSPNPSFCINNFKPSRTEQAFIVYQVIILLMSCT